MVLISLTLGLVILVSSMFLGTVLDSSISLGIIVLDSSIFLRAVLVSSMFLGTFLVSSMLLGIFSACLMLSMPILIYSSYLSIDLSASTSTPYVVFKFLNRMS